MTLHTGDSFGHYSIQHYMAQGGTGDVYQAIDTRDGQPIALKIPTKAIRYDPRQYDFFLRELAALPDLHHPGIQRYLESGHIEETPYLATALIEGRSLREWIKSVPLTVEQAIPVIRGTAAALIHCHAQGVIHRDLKPENILIMSADFPVIIDFGLAISRKRPPSNVPGGTPDYMAPEQVQGWAEDWRVDLYQLGIVLYEVLIGTVPFTDPDPLTAMRLRLHQPIPRADRVRSELPASLATIIARCLQIDRDQRYSTMADLIADLDHLDQVSTADLDRLTQPPPRPSFWKSPPGQAIVTTLAFVAAIAVVTLILIALKR